MSPGVYFILALSTGKETKIESEGAPTAPTRHIRTPSHPHPVPSLSPVYLPAIPSSGELRLLGAAAAAAVGATAGGATLAATSAATAAAAAAVGAATCATDASASAAASARLPARASGRRAAAASAAPVGTPDFQSLVRSLHNIEYFGFGQLTIIMQTLNARFCCRDWEGHDHVLLLSGARSL